MSHIILVLGCHRSGTSVVARSMQCLGAELGARAEWSAADNPTGFWENQDVLALDERLLRLLGSAWDDPRPIHWPDTSDWLRCAGQLAAFAGEGLRRDLTDHPLLAIKEPRLCRLLPFWRPLLAGLGCQVSVVHAVRPPLAVARSLKKRNGIPIERGLDLWLEYTRRARADVDAAWPTCTIDYETLMLFPRPEVERMAGLLGLPDDPDATLEFAEDFVDESLWHETGSDNDDRRLPSEIAVLWQLTQLESRKWR